MNLVEDPEVNIPQKTASEGECCRNPVMVVSPDEKQRRSRRFPRSLDARVVAGLPDVRWERNRWKRSPWPKITSPAREMMASGGRETGQAWGTLRNERLLTPMQKEERGVVASPCEAVGIGLSPWQ